MAAPAAAEFGNQKGGCCFPCSSRHWHGAFGSVSGVSRQGARGYPRAPCPFGANPRRTAVNAFATSFGYRGRHGPAVHLLIHVASAGAPVTGRLQQRTGRSAAAGE